MDSHNRSKRPHLVERAADKLRGEDSTESSTLGTGTDDAHPLDSSNGLNTPHLAVVGAQPADDALHAGDSNMPPEDPPQPQTRPPRRSRIKPALLLLLLILLSMLAFWAVQESRTSHMQAKFFSQLVAKVNYKMAPGPSDAIRFPSDSPYDARLGYSNLPDYLGKQIGRAHV